ncbi:MAG: hypothetical protein JWO20_313 [Candidatus Angelobacter sp.]|jgi:hypothetical protein|nr:hypothetical protein [Candidatus Angelobacter sp.]
MGDSTQYVKYRQNALGNDRRLFVSVRCSIVCLSSDVCSEPQDAGGPSRSGLTLLGIYEIWMIHWEKTVSAAIRLDMFLEIPLMFVLILWGVLGIIFSGRRRT